MRVFLPSVAKCRGSWVVSRGRGCGSWVNVVGKKKFSKKKHEEVKSKSCKIHETKISAYIPVLFPPLGQQSKS